MFYVNVISLSICSQFHAFFGNYVLSIFVSVIATLAFETPVLMIERLMMNEPKLYINIKKLNGFKQNQTEIILKLLKKHD